MPTFEKVCEWQSLSLPEELASRVADSMAAYYSLLHEPPEVPPFQFTLPLAFAIWYTVNRKDLEAGRIDGFNDDKEKILNYAKKLESFCESPERGLKGKWSPPFIRLEAAKQFGLLALSYFSWEPTRAVFLVRRTYPHCFDFMSYSQCPAGWGALGAMLRDIDKHNKEQAEPIAVTASKYQSIDPESLLPFLVEIKRVGHEAAACFPIYGLDSGDLVGTYLLLIAKDVGLPATKDVFHRLIGTTQLRTISQNVAKVVDQQANLMHLNTLPQLWCTEATEGGSRRPVFAEIKITAESPGLLNDIRTCADRIIRDLSNSTFYVLRCDKKGTAGRPIERIFVATNSGSYPGFEELKGRVLDVVHRQFAAIAGMRSEFIWWAKSGKELVPDNEPAFDVTNEPAFDVTTVLESVSRKDNFDSEVPYW